MIYTVKRKEKINQSTEQFSPRTSKPKEIENQMTPRRRKTRLVLKKFLRANKNTLKELEKKVAKAKPYTREPWMMRFNPTEDKYEEFLRKEAESF